MTTNSHLFLDTLEQMRELLSSPDIESRANDVFLTQTIEEFYALIDEYALAQNFSIDTTEDSEQIQDILGQLGSKIDVINKHVNTNLDKLNFVSKITPKKYLFRYFKKNLCCFFLIRNSILYFD